MSKHNDSFKPLGGSLRHSSIADLKSDRSRGLEPSMRVSLRLSRASDPGDTPATARSLGVFPGRRRIKETVGKNDKDLYALTFTDISDVRISFRNRSKVSMVASILNNQGQVVSLGGDRLSVKVKPKEAFKDVYEELPPGTYYLQVRSQRGSKNVYRLQLSVSNPFPSCGCGS